MNEIFEISRQQRFEKGVLGFHYRHFSTFLHLILLTLGRGRSDRQATRILSGSGSRRVRLDSH
jgi:hypothetical protein